MPDQDPKSRPQPPGPPENGQPPVYGDQWGSSGKQNDAERGQKDRPGPIEAPPRPTGTPDPESR